MLNVTVIPLQTVALPDDCIDTLRADGSVIVTEAFCVVEHITSVTVTVYVPADKELKS
jgi:hypothetical protein